MKKEEKDEKDRKDEREGKERRKLQVRYLLITLLCLIVSVIYGFFSHGIHSFWMRGLAVWPFFLGLVPAALTASGAEQGYDPRREFMKDIYRFGIAAVTVASFLKGVMEIAGTDSLYPDVLLFAGAAMLLCGVVGILYIRIRLKPGDDV